MRKVDIWGGVDGFAELWEGFLLSDTPDNNGLYNILVTSKEFLDDIGFDEPWDVTAYKLEKDHCVEYDGFAWSELGDVKADENGLLWPISEPPHIPTPKEIALRETVIALTNHFDNILKEY